MAASIVSTMYNLQGKAFIPIKATLDNADLPFIEEVDLMLIPEAF